jgi:hypothetical protein
MVTPLLYSYIYFKNTTSLALFEHRICAPVPPNQQPLGSYIQSLHIYLSREEVSSSQLISILVRSPNLRMFLSYYNELEGGAVTRIAPAIGQSLRVLTAEVYDMFSFRLLEQLQGLEELEIAASAYNKLDWSLQDGAAGITLPHVVYFRVIVWELNETRRRAVHRWLWPCLAKSTFPALRRVRTKMFWRPDSDAAGNLSAFFRRHPQIVDLVWFVSSEMDLAGLPHLFPITTMLFSVWAGPQAFEVLPKTVTRLQFMDITYKTLEVFCLALLSKPTLPISHVREFWICSLQFSFFLDYPCFTWKRFKFDVSMESGGLNILYDYLLSLSRNLGLQKPHGIDLLDSEGHPIISRSVGPASILLNGTSSNHQSTIVRSPSRGKICSIV